MVVLTQGFYLQIVITEAACTNDLLILMLLRRSPFALMHRWWHRHLIAFATLLIAIQQITFLSSCSCVPNELSEVSLLACLWFWDMVFLALNHCQVGKLVFKDFCKTNWSCKITVQYVVFLFIKSSVQITYFLIVLFQNVKVKLLMKCFNVDLTL